MIASMPSITQPVTVLQRLAPLPSTFLQFPHPQHPEHRQPVPRVDPPFVGGAEQVDGPGHAQVFGPAFAVVDRQAAGGGEAL